MAGLEINKAIISGRYAGSTGDGRTCYEFIIDLPDGAELMVSDIRSGCGGGSLQSGFESLLDFLGAAEESYRYHSGDWSKIGPDDNASIFERPLVEWAYQNSDEITMLELELTETPNLIEE